MTLTIAEILRSVMPNIGLVVNPDGTYRIGVEDVNSDEILAALNLIREDSVITPITGNGAAVQTVAPGADFHFSGIRFHLGSALAAGETLTITVNHNLGVAFDTVLYSQDLGTGGILDVVVECEGKAYDFGGGEEIIVALSANVGADVWGCETIYHLR